MRIQQASVADAPAILDLQKLCYQSEAELYNDYTIPPLLQTIEQLSEELRSMVVLKAVEDSAIIGSVRAGETCGTCCIGRLIVHPDRQNQGIGKELMAAVEHMFPDVCRYELFTGNRSWKNLSLYARIGYREFKREALTDTVTLVYLEKVLSPEQAHTSTQDNKRMVTRLYSEGWGQGRLEVLDAAWAPIHVLHWNEQTRSDQQRTVAELQAIVSAYRTAFPDLRVQIDRLVAEGDDVAVQVTFEGTHVGIYEGFEPTTKRSRFTDMQILTFDKGRIAETTLGSGGLRYFSGILDGSVLSE